jgi:DNA-binding LytR/AlgR family response regulator
VAERNQNRDEEVLFLRVGGAVESVLMSEILYIESHGHTITVHTAARAVSAYEKLSDLAERLPENFLQTHKSYYINMRQIQRFQSNDILLKNGISVPVSRSRYSKAKESYFYFMGREF